MRKVPAFAICLPALFLFVAGCSPGGEAARSVGQLESDRIELTAEFAEPILSRNVIEGQAVRQGEVLIELDKSRIVIAIDEAERGLHPYLLGELMGFWRRLSSGELGGKPVQIILATHSAELLAHAQPHEVRFLSRSNDDGSVCVREAQTDTPEWEEAFREYAGSLGDIWLAGGLGGVPAR